MPHVPRIWGHGKARRPLQNKAAFSSAGTLTKGTVPLPGGETAIYNSTGLEFIRHTNYLGSSVLATTWAHAVYSKEAYAPFGETYNEAGTADRSFTGQDQDTVTGATGTGIYDYLFRKYDPAAGRWLSPDPEGWASINMSDPQSFNRYAYVENEPMNATDPDGKACLTDDGNGGISIDNQAVNEEACAQNGIWIPGSVYQSDIIGAGTTYDDNDGVLYNANVYSINGNNYMVDTTPVPDFLPQALQSDDPWAGMYMLQAMFSPENSGSFIAADTVVTDATIGYACTVGVLLAGPVVYDAGMTWLAQSLGAEAATANGLDGVVIGAYDAGSPLSYEAVADSYGMNSFNLESTYAYNTL